MTTRKNISNNLGFESFDPLGTKAVGEAGKLATDFLISTAKVLLNSICKPALEELGLLVRDKIQNWRLLNIVRMLEKANGKLDFNGKELKLKAHPKVGIKIIEQSSLEDDEFLQDLWAGLFASSCTENGKDDSNLIFIELLKNLTKSQAIYLKYLCEHSPKKIIVDGNAVTGEFIEFSLKETKKIIGLKDVSIIDLQIDYLRSLQLIAGGLNTFDPQKKVFKVRLTSLGIYFYYKISGSRVDIMNFYKSTIVN
jgi:hypothetical protein